MLDTAVVPAARLDKTGRLLAANDQWLNSFDAAPAVGSVFADALAPTSQASFAKGMHDAVIDGTWLAPLQFKEESRTRNFHLRHLPATLTQPAAFIVQATPSSTETPAERLAPLALAIVGIDKSNRISTINEEGARFFPEAKLESTASDSLPPVLSGPLEDNRKSAVVAINLKTVPQIRAWILQEPDSQARTILAEDVSD